MKRPVLLPLTPLFGAAVAGKNFAYNRGWAKPHRLRWPVISVGSLCVGGAGKTPLVIRLAQLLRSQGFEVDVLSRGYGRDGNMTECVMPDGAPERFGDEPLLIARNAGVPVFVGANRFAAGLLAEQSLQLPGIHLLDDGFQHRQLARAVDIVLVGRRDLGDTMLPAGDLREPLNSLSRATILAVRAGEEDVVSHLRARHLAQPVWMVERRLDVPVTAERSIAFCGIGRPEEFLSEVKARNESAGNKVVGWQRFPDHHRYTPSDMEQLAGQALRSGADGFLTTEKDAIKLNPELLGILERVAAVRIVRLEVRLQDEQAVICGLLSHLGRSAGPGIRVRE